MARKMSTEVARSVAAARWSRMTPEDRELQKLESSLSATRRWDKIKHARAETARRKRAEEDRLRRRATNTLNAEEIAALRKLNP